MIMRQVGRVLESVMYRTKRVTEKTRVGESEVSCERHKKRHDAKEAACLDSVDT